MKALLIRHATSSHQAPEAPLAPEGYAQAKALLRVLSRLGAAPLFASPFRRALETLTPYADASGQDLAVLKDLRERRLATADLPDWKAHIRRSFEDADHAAPGGESHTDLRRRAATALRRIAEVGGPLPAFATHGGLTAALFNACDPTFGFEEWQSLRNPDVFEVEIEHGCITAFTRYHLELQT